MMGSNGTRADVGTDALDSALALTLICKRRYTNRDLMEDRFGRLYHLPVTLARLGHSVQVLCLDYRAGAGPSAMVAEGVEFRSVPVVRPDLVLGAWRTMRDRSTGRGHGVILASGDIHFGALADLAASRLGCPWVFDCYDDYRYFAAARVPGMRALFGRLVGAADAVIAAGPPLAERLTALGGRVTVIENGIDDRLFRPLERAQCRADLGIGVLERVIGYFGSITPERGSRVLLDAFSILTAHNGPTRLLLAGHAAAPELLAVPGVDYRGLVGQSLIPQMIGACDVVVIPYLDDPMINATNACKISEYLACGVPVVASEVSDMASFFAATPRCLTRPGDARALAQAIADQIDDPIRTPLPPGLTWRELGRRAESLLLRLVGLDGTDPGAAR